jgi:hypothetical protein
MSIDWAIIIALIIILLLGMWFLPRIFIKRAINQVIDIMRRNNAVNPKNAKTVEELGLQPRTMLEGMMRLRDYKPRALQYLMYSEIIQQADDDKIYLSEEKLQETRFKGK